jgi:SAM-dependent methyltransferase
VNKAPYDVAFYRDHSEKARTSAEAIVPILIERLRPQSVIDIGCGTGVWLAVFASHGVDDVTGVDGDWVLPDALEISRERFVAARLDRPFRLDRTFDLAMSLEVAEHLPERAAAAFVETLVRLAPYVLFSAAIPHQGGLQHVNEQWPDYWAARFARHGYEVVDAIRPRVWSTAGVAFWYQQNALIFARRDVLAANPLLAADRAATVDSMVRIVHPTLLAKVAQDPSAHVRRETARDLSARDLMHAAPHALVRSIRWRLGRRRRESV